MSSPAAFDTIVAPATPLGRSALAIVRIDGPESASILQRLNRDTLPSIRQATHIQLNCDGDVIDDCVAIRYEAPHSFTGNDLVELTLHGNPLLVQRAIDAAIRLGARMAEPGEFTERAVLNGKLDLVQAESIADLINARTSLQAKLSLENLDGMLSRTAAKIRESLLHVISRLEATLDFADEGYAFIHSSETLRRLSDALADCARLAGTFRRGRATTQGLTAVILGRPNAGKSTLLNRLVGSDHAIVTPIPGTTRDIVRATIEIGGLPVEIADTAGLRDTDDLVEGIGVKRARDAAQAAELVLYLIDSTVGLKREDQDELDAVMFARRGTPASVITIFTKTDLAAAPSGELGISVTDEAGIEQLFRLLDERVRANFAPPEASATVVNQRQFAAVAVAAEALREAMTSLNADAREEMLLVDLYRASRALGSLTGEITSDDVYTEIFSKFCIGK